MVARRSDTRRVNCTAAQAVPLFNDTFDSEALGLNQALDNWTVSDGTIDVIGPGFFDLHPGNGNYLERLLGALVLAADAPLLAAARELVRPVLSRHVARHYRGFAHSQLEAFDAAPSAKRALYVLRTAATGRCLLATGVLETDVARLPDFVPPEIGELIELKQAAERQPPEVRGERHKHVVGREAFKFGHARGKRGATFDRQIPLARCSSRGAHPRRGWSADRLPWRAGECASSSETSTGQRGRG